MSLFSKRARTDTSPGKYSETLFVWLDRSAQAKAERVRAVLEGWFNEYPAAHKQELRARLETQFETASFELLLHAYFLRLGFAIEPHPRLSHSPRRPDFLVTDQTCGFYVEATTVRDESVQDIALRNVKNQVLDAINTISSPNFFLALRRLTIKPGKQPIARRIKAFLEREVAKHDPDSVSVVGALSDGPELVFEDDTVRLNVHLIPRSPSARGRADLRPIGMGPLESYLGNPEAVYRDSVAAKARRYGQLDASYIVAANYLGPFGIETDVIEDALFGGIGLALNRKTGRSEPRRVPDGAFAGPKGPRNRRVSAVLASSIMPWSLSQARFELYHNPWAERPLACALPIRQARVRHGRLDWVDGTPLLHVFGLPSGWPLNPAA